MTHIRIRLVTLLATVLALDSSGDTAGLTGIFRYPRDVEKLVGDWELPATRRAAS